MRKQSLLETLHRLGLCRAELARPIVVLRIADLKAEDGVGERCCLFAPRRNNPHHDRAIRPALDVVFAGIHHRSGHGKRRREYLAGPII